MSMNGLFNGLLLLTATVVLNGLGCVGATPLSDREPRPGGLVAAFARETGLNVLRRRFEIASFRWEVHCSLLLSRRVRFGVEMKPDLSLIGGNDGFLNCVRK